MPSSIRLSLRFAGSRRKIVQDRRPGSRQEEPAAQPMENGMVRRTVFAFWLASTICLARPSEAATQNPALPPDLARAAAAYDQAQIKSDGAALADLLADDYQLVNGACQISNKAQFIADSTAPGSTLEPYIVENAINRVWPDGAVLSGEVNLKGVTDGKPFAIRTRFADIWRRQHGKWQVVFTEVTRFPHPVISS
jgi:ketosteroid isomerase-like protein